MSKWILACLLAVSVLLVGCGITPVPGAEITEEGCLLFSAEGASPVLKADDAMALLEARVAAAAMAKANLLEKIKGAYIAAEVETEDLAFASQAAGVSVEGILARATLAYEPADRTGRAAHIVTAVASLELTEEEFCNLSAYVE